MAIAMEAGCSVITVLCKVLSDCHAPFAFVSHCVISIGLLRFDVSEVIIPSVSHIYLSDSVSLGPQLGLHFDLVLGWTLE
jgi:hypothetical protein